MAKSNEVKPKPMASKKKTTQKALVKNISAKKPPKKELTARGRTKLNQAPKTKKNPAGAGKPAQIVEVINRLKKYKDLPIFSLAKVTTIARVSERTLAEYYAKGKDEFEKGILPWDGKKKKGSKYVQFYHMILAGRELAIMRATRTYLLGIDTDWKAAAKFLATVMSEHWSERLKIEHSGNIDSMMYIDIPQLHKLAEAENVKE